MREAILSTVLHSRDAAADQQAAAAAAMAAWSAGIAYAINFIVLYLTMTLLVVFVVGIMGCLASSRIRKSPSFIIILASTVLCSCALAIHVTMNKNLVVNPQKGFNADLYTALIALSMAIPFLVDFTLILRILAFFPTNSTAATGPYRWKRWAAIAFPSLIKIPHVILISHYVHFVYTCGLVATDMSDIVVRVNKEQWALTEWSLMLADEFYCTIFFCIKLYELGWGWGEDKHVSRNFLDTLRRILISALASFVIPSFLLITLFAMQALLYKPWIEGYIFATFVPLTVNSAAFATIWPAIRADRIRQKTASHPVHTFRSQGASNKFLTTQRSFDTDDEKEIGKTHNQSQVELAELEHHVATLKHRHEVQDASARTVTCDSDLAARDADSHEAIALQRLTRPNNTLRHAPDVSGIAITTVTEEKWSEA
ncbi:hypothetical protein NDA16_005030 [Ustilago loliicola]|nr:hypothetical protein NDA16_005030 [Ustilago loliicola]